MSQDLVIRQQDLVSNPTARVPVCLCLDTSGSMADESESSHRLPIDELNEGVALFFKAIQEDEIAKFSAEIAVVTFGDVVTKVVDLGSITRQGIPVLTASGSTPMGQAVTAALDVLDARKKEYSSAGIDYYQPWLVLMTDGRPTDSIDAAARRCAELVANKKLTLFPIGIGAEADMQTLSKFSPNRTPLHLRELNFRAFFEWLSKSVSRVSQSIPGESVPLDEKGIKGWAEL